MSYTSKKIEAPAVSTPSGGGALRGIGEPFKTQGFTGGGGFSIPFPVPQARGIAPSVTLTYNSGAGNGNFGLGFEVALDSIVRKVSSGVPRYDDTDVFISGSYGELVPACVLQQGKWVPVVQTVPVSGQNWIVRQYRPQSAGAFPLIEWWISADAGNSYWQIITDDNITHIFGQSDNTRIFNPVQPEQVFEWLIETTSDAHENKIVYEYKAGDTVNIPAAPENEGRDFTSQRYPWSISYGNYKSTPGEDATDCYAFRVLFNYGQLDAENPDAPAGSWTSRPDAFSVYKSGFEIRTARRCNGIWLQHFFNGENNSQPFITRALLLNYTTAATTGLSLLSTAAMRGYKTIPDQSGSGTMLWKQDSPPVTLHYQSFDFSGQSWQRLQADAPGYLGSSGFLATDLDGLGMDGLLYSTDSFTGYLEPLGGGRYKPMRVLEEFPSLHKIAEGQSVLTSLNGNYVPDLVLKNSAQSGYFERADFRVWEAFRPFDMRPLQEEDEAGVFVDLSGSGRADLVYNAQQDFHYYASLGKTGYAAAVYRNEPAGFPEDTQHSSLTGYADLIGDGLSHRYRIGNGTVEVWPSLGHGQFGNRIVLNNAPYVASGFDASRFFMLDANGTGAVDIAYAFADVVRIWFNQNGNSFSAPVDIPLPGAYSQLAAFTTGDVTGYGTSSLIFTTADTGVAHWYFDFSGAAKPYLLYQMENGIGGTSSIAYSSSVLQHLRDREEGRPWLTVLPMAVQVVASSTITDNVTGSVYTSTYAYHDGFFDTAKREFRGFGYTESRDMEQLLAYDGNDHLQMPAIYTRTWSLMGTYAQTPALLRQYQSEFYKGDSQAWDIEPFTFDDSWLNCDPQTLQQGFAHLAGTTIRTEVYGLDSTPEEAHPYTVSMDGVLLRLLQPCVNLQHACVQVLPVNNLSYTYDRNPADPVISQQFQLAWDSYGNITQSAAVSYPRRSDAAPFIYREQSVLHCMATTTSYINVLQNNPGTPGNSWQYIGAGWQSQAYEIGNLTAPVNAPFEAADLLALVNTALQTPLTEPIPSGAWSRLLSWSRSFYWNDNGTLPLPGGSINKLALVHHSEQIVTDTAQLNAVFGDALPADAMTDCGYIYMDNFWWNQGLIQYYFWSGENYYLPWKTVPCVAGKPGYPAYLDAVNSVVYDEYQLFVTQLSAWYSESAALQTTYTYDYTALAPSLVTDPNANCNAVLYDALGAVLATSGYGDINNDPVGDLPLDQYIIHTDATFDDVVKNPAKYLQGASAYFFSDPDAWQLRQQPVSSISITRMEHVQTLLAAGKTQDETDMPFGITYSDGLGRELQSKAKATPGSDVLQIIEGVVVNPSPEPETTDRWLVSGYTIYNNKGLPAEQYLPYFSASPYYENQLAVIEAHLVPPPAITFYDALGRVVKSVTPKGFFAQTVYTPWETTTYDLNDTMPDSPYYKAFMAAYPQQPTAEQQAEYNALQAALPCYNTPLRAVLDNLGNTIRTVACNLGAIASNAIPQDVASPQTPLQAWQALQAAGYLSPTPDTQTPAWVTAAFQPYQSGFHDIFINAFPDNGAKLEEYLAQSCMTALAVYDIRGQQVLSADARLFLKMVREGTLYYNFRNTYSYDGTNLRTESADAGTRRLLQNIFGQIAWNDDGRGFVFVHQYDQLTRPVSITVTGGDGVAMNNVTSVVVYGETVPGASSYNLNGKPYQVYEEGGLMVNKIYDLAGNSVQRLSYLRPDYKTPANWTVTAQQEILQQVPFQFFTFYNAVNNLVAKHLPDGSRLAYTYDISGRLTQSAQQLQNPVNGLGALQPVITGIVYDALNQRTKITYGNGVSSVYTYDALTGSLLHTKSVRMGTTDNVLQDLYYTYDPVGNKIQIKNAAAAVVYNKNAQINPVTGYTYDPLYRLTGSTGVSQPGLSTPDSSGYPSGQPPFPPISDLQNLENYSEYYTYDFGNNMVRKKHRSASKNWIQYLQIEETTNRLNRMWVGSSEPFPGMPVYTYDGCGNTMQLSPRSASPITWNYMNQLASATLVNRKYTDPESGNLYLYNDAEYYQYTAEGSRIRKVQELLVNGQSLVEYSEKIYFENYQLTRNWVQPVDALPGYVPEIKSEVHAVLADDGGSTVLISNTWFVAPSGQKIRAGDIQYRYQLSDPLDSVTMEVDQTAATLTYEMYFAFGGTAFIMARSQLEADTKLYRYCGKERDAVTGLYYYGSRYYAQWLGRWMSTDPAGAVDGTNLYAYAGNNPVNFNDPTGNARSGVKGTKTNTKAKAKGPKDFGTFSKTKTHLQSRVSHIKDLMIATHGSKIVQVGKAHQATIYSGTKELVVKKAKMTDERLLVRHLSTSLLAQNTEMVEVQAAVSHADKKIYVASNSKQSWLAGQIGSGKKLKDLARPDASEYEGREARHINKLADDIDKKTPGSGDTDETKITYGDYELVHISGFEEMHAEIKILSYLHDAKLDFNFVGGTRRPCTACFIVLQKFVNDPSKYNPHHGAYWEAKAALLSLGYMEESIASSVLDSYFYVNEGLKGKARFNYDTDSEDEDKPLVVTRVKRVKVTIVDDRKSTTKRQRKK